MDFAGLVDLSARVIEAAGVFTIVGGSVVSAIWAAVELSRDRDLSAAYRGLRHHIGRAILLGLELLVGADIIRTVAEIPTLRGVLVLAVIVLIRTFLSFTLEVELEGRWPWQTRRGASDPPSR